MRENNQRLTKEQIDTIAREEGFSEFRRQLDGYGGYYLYYNESKTEKAVYDPRTGQKMSSNKINPGRERFIHPEQFIKKHKIN